MRLSRIATVFGLALALLAPAAPAPAQSGYDLVQACKDNGGPPALCRGLWQNLRIPGGLCRDTVGDPACAAFDGITIDEAAVLAQEKSWLNKALALQRGLDDDQPLQDELWMHTHNSFNADAYDIQVAGGLDRNHIYSIRDQLRMGARAVEIDIHWSPSIEAGGANALQVCHGTEIPLPTGGNYHFGCDLNSPALLPHLEEIKAWMDANPDEVVMLYLENNLENDPEAHTLAADAIEDVFGDVLYRPASSCAEIPMDVTREHIRDSGARILITGNCGQGAWNDLVHVRGARWIEGGLDDGDDFPAYPCTEERAAEKYDVNWIRHWGDETGLSAGAGTGGDVTPTDALNMTRCGVNMVGWDNLVPFDARTTNLVWSWKADEPSVSKRGYCATQDDDGRFLSKKCAGVTANGRTHFTKQSFACFDGTAWAVTKRADRWSMGTETCKKEGLGAFSVPWNGYENERLKEAAASHEGGIWLRYRASRTGAWIS